MTRDLFELKQNFHIRRITSDYLPYANNFIGDLRELIIAEDHMYPGIDDWFSKKVMTGLQNAERVAYVGYIDDSPVVSAVVKSGQDAKFCHLKILESAREQSIGDIFFTLMTLDVRRRAKNVHFTLPEGLWETKKEFFRSFGFETAEKNLLQYRKSEDELACRAPFSSVLDHAINRLPKIASQFTIGDYSLDNKVLLSVAPRFAKQIVEGIKTVELRKRFSSRWAGTRMSIYATSPIQEVVGEALIEKVEEDVPAAIWEKYGDKIGCSKGEFESYVSGSEKISALLLNDIRKFHSGVSLEQMRHLIGKELRPPQSFSNLANNEPWAQAISVASILQGQVSKGSSPIIL